MIPWEKGKSKNLKIGPISGVQHKKQEKLIKETLDFDENDVFVAYSSETHEGREEVLEIFEDLIKQYHEVLAEMALEEE